MARVRPRRNTVSNIQYAARRGRRKEKLANTIAEGVLRDIRVQGLQSGDQLPKESEMLEQYGVGRGTLREAMRVLEMCGLISLKPGPRGGPVVESVNPEDFARMTSLFLQFANVTYREVFEARLILEPVAVRLAAQRQKGSAAAAELVRLAEGGSSSKDEDSYLHVTADFHASMIGLGDNGVVTLLCQSLAEIYRERVTGGLFPASRQKSVHKVHVEIAQAIFDGDADLAERLTVDHMRQYTDYIGKRHPALLDEVVRWQ
jgi:DNA-binding FadR family transcriptional regulator